MISAENNCFGSAGIAESFSGTPSTYRHFEVSEAEGRVRTCTPIPVTSLPLWASDVSQEKWDWSQSETDSIPLFHAPIPFVIPPAEGANEPFFLHNHQPSIAWVDNGDLLAIWFSTMDERGVELTVLASRLRAGNAEWDASSEFFKAQNRNMSGSSLFNDGRGVLYHFNGIGAAGIRRDQSKNQALILRVSTDNGRSWSVPLAIDPEYRNDHQVISGTLVTRHGVMIQPCDVAQMKGSNQSTIYISRDRGITWFNPGRGRVGSGSANHPMSGSLIAGIHAGVVELNDGRLMALSRRHEIEERMPVSISRDTGETWTYAPSPFPPIGGGQRCVFMRLREGPLLLVSFTDKRKADEKTGLSFQDNDGKEFTGYGLFAALSFDEGDSWPIKKLITPGSVSYTHLTLPTN